MSRSLFRIILFAVTTTSPLLAQTPAPTAQEAFEAAKKLYDRGEWADALEAFQKFERDQKFSTALPQTIYLEGWCWFNLKHYQEAASAFERVINSYPAANIVPEAILKRAECLRELDDFDHAADLCREFQTRFPKNQLFPQALLGEAWAQFKHKDLDGAKAIVQRVRDKYRDDPVASLDALLLLVQILTEENDRDGARDVLRQIAAQPSNPHATEALYLAAESMFDAKRYGDAITYFQLVDSKASLFTNVQQQIGDRPHLHASALFRLGNCYQALGKPEDAGVAYQDLLDKYPNDQLAEKAHFVFLQTLLDRRQFEQAIGETEKFRQKYPKSALLDSISFLQAESMFEEGRYQDALDRYLKFHETRSEPRLIETAEYRIGACYYGLKLFDKARNAFTQFTQSFPQSKMLPDALVGLGRSCFEIAHKSSDPKTARPNLAEAVKSFERIRTSYPQFEHLAEVTLQLGYLYSYLGENDKALDTFTEFTKRWPDNRLMPEAVYQIARNHLVAQRYDKAVVAYTELVQRYPDSELAPLGAYEIGTSCAAANRPADMVAAFRAYVEKYPNHARVGDALYAIGQQLESEKKPGEGIVAYRAIVAKAAADPSSPMRDAAIGAESRIAALLAPKDAIVDCERFLAKFASDPVAARSAVAQIAQLYRGSELVREGYATFDRLASQYQTNVAIRVAAATSTVDLALGEKDYQRAYASALKLLADPDRERLPASSYLAIGEAMLKTDRDAEASDAFEKVLKLYPDDARVLPLANLGIGQAYFGLKNLDRAEAAFKSVRAANPRNFDAQLWIGKVYEARGNVKEAVAMYDPVWRQGSGDAAREAAFRVGMIAFRDKDCRTALPMFARLLFATGPMAEEAAFRAAQCYDALGNVEQARSAYQAYLRRFPVGTFVIEARALLAKLPAPAHS